MRIETLLKDDFYKNEIRCLILGKTIGQIATELNYSYGGANDKVKKIFKKLNISNRFELTALVIRYLLNEIRELNRLNEKMCVELTEKELEICCLNKEK